MVNGDAAGFVKLCVNVIAQQRRDVRQLVVDAINIPHSATPTTAARRAVWEWARERPDAGIFSAILDQGLDDAVRLLNAIDDHAHAIEVLLNSKQGLMSSALTIQRGLVEAALRFCSLMDSSIPPVKTYLRMAAFQLEAVEGSASTGEKFGADMPAEKLRQTNAAAAGVRKLLEENGFVLKKRKESDNYTYSIGFEGTNETVPFNATDAAKRFLPGESFQWSITSGAVHSSAWFLPTTVGGVDEDALSTPNEVYTGVVAGLLGASTAIVTIVAGHSGLDVDAVQKRTHTRLKAILARHTGAEFSMIDHETYRARAQTDDWRIDPSHMGDSFAKSRSRWIKGDEPRDQARP